MVLMDVKGFIAKLGFTPKDGTKDIYHKVYVECDNYAIDVDFGTKSILYGDKIQADSKTTQNFSQLENFVVLECVDRLLRKGYKPENIILEKTWPSGRGTSGRLDICVNKEDGTPYLLIECKTAGKEFDKELTKIRKDGGQIFTYFQLSGHKADVLMLYSSDIERGCENYQNEIIKIEDEYRNGEVKDIFEKWNKLTKDNGIFDSWVNPYNFQNKALTKEQLKEITAEDSSFIFNRFLEILRHNVVSDKGNAFNKIFTLFLCKVYDETTTEDGEELKFQWLEGRDNHVDFQLRLTDLYSKGMKKFLDRTVSDFNDDDFEQRCATLSEDTKEYLRREVNKLRLEKNNEFAIKEVYDPASFEENAKVVKEVVELIQGYRIRYNKRQQYLSDFFELLLTTGLKQEAGQFFTPVPVAQFIIKSLPIDSIVKEKLSRKDGEILPYMIDYAAGSGHFITEYMHEIQDIIDNCDTSKYISETKGHLTNWKCNHFDWATTYVYGIEKDYRLVKVGKVGCYLHGDGLANVILSDGLANFNKNREYKGKLCKSNDDGQKDNQQFDVLLSNPPYSVSAFRQTTRDYYTEKDFELYAFLTDNSKEIEALFVERAKQLLKDGGVAGIILPSSILSKGGVYTKTREIILQYFDIVGIVELGGKTFMATNTSTVVLFLRRRNNYFCKNTRELVDTYFRTFNDVTINGIESPVEKYVAQVWGTLSYEDYLSLLQKRPSEIVKKHDIYIDYINNIVAKNDIQFLDEVVEREREKIYYYILAYSQQVVIVKSGDKDIEKEFLGYEFSDRRGNEGIHAIKRGKNIDECTKMFDSESYSNPEKASTYIYQAFNGDFNTPIADSMQSHISRSALVDMVAFDRSAFDKAIATTTKKKIITTSKWPIRKLKSLCEINPSKDILKSYDDETIVSFVDMQSVSNNGYIEKLEDRKLGSLRNGSYSFFIDGDVIIAKITPCMENGKCAYVENLTNGIALGSTEFHVFRSDSNLLNNKYLFYFLNRIEIRNIAAYNMTGASGHRRVPVTWYEDLEIPLPPLDIQKHIVQEIEIIEDKERNSRAIIAENNLKINELFSKAQMEAIHSYRISNTDLFSLNIGKRVLTSELVIDGTIPVYSANVFEPFGYIDNLIIEEFDTPSILWGIDGDWMVKYMPEQMPFYPTDHCGVLRVLSSNISTRYLAWVLEMAGKEKQFSRQLRASIDRIAGITVQLPSIDRQKEIVRLVEQLENRNKELSAIIEDCKLYKTTILHKFLM